MQIGIFGGSFNPVHYGHINLAKEILRQDLADEVWLMVSPRNPLKQQADLLDEQTRLRLTRLALADVPGVFASDDEFSTFDWLFVCSDGFPQAQRLKIIVTTNNKENIFFILKIPFVMIFIEISVNCLILFYNIFLSH